MKNNVIKMSLALENMQHEKGAHAWNLQEMTPQGAVVQLHLENLIATYGQDVVKNVIKGMKLNQAKRKAS